MRATSVAILAMGGEGGGVLADWIVDVAEHAGYRAQTTSVPGVAQRTGATIYYVEIFPASDREPVLALMPVPGEVDVVIASELMEAGRAVQRGLVTSDRTTLIMSTHRVYSMTERTASADGRVDSATLLEGAKQAARLCVSRDFSRIAEDNKSVISAALLGALAATHALPFERRQFEEAIDRGGVGVASSRAAFAAGLAAAKNGDRPTAVPAPATSSVGPRLAALASRVQQSYPAVSHEILIAGIQRLADYQDERYAAEYLDRLEPVRDVDSGDYLVLKETARYLALWMSYEDAIRVADLKIRGGRFARVVRESRATDRQVVHISEFLHPQIGELADIAPAWLGRWMLNSSTVRWVVGALTKKGTILQTTSLSGFARLYVLAALRPTRRGSLRFRVEHAKIVEWIERIPALAETDYALAVEVAQCPRLVKGYGETHERGSQRFDAVMRAVPELRAHDDAAVRLRALREAALAEV
ncbi:MAG TPA: indolepyruvate oxidoreductase subunit beta family protein [Gemmatimonadaceae bacterium]|nr:indolepyruvate oxidoreductase subunit beta family protein [Gemmatimonadaceae bacterium]